MKPRHLANIRNNSKLTVNGCPSFHLLMSLLERSWLRMLRDCGSENLLNSYQRALEWWFLRLQTYAMPRLYSISF